MDGKTRNLYKKTITLYSLYLVLGGIAFYNFIIYISTIIRYYGIYYGESTSELWVYCFVTLSAGVFLAITYLGFVRSKKYSRFTGIVGCLLLLFYSIYYILIESSGNISFEDLSLFVPQISLLIASIIMLNLTMIYWKKLV